MLALSAPSANTCTRNSDTDFVFVFITRLLQTGIHDPVGGFAQRSHRSFRRLSGLSLAIAVIDQNRFAPCGVAGIDVAPAISNNKAASQIDIVLALGLIQQARLRFAAIAVILIVMIADQDIVDWQQRSQSPMHRFDRLAALRAAGNIRLVRDYVEIETVRLQVEQGRSNLRQELELFQPGWRKRFTVTHEGAVKHSVAVEKNRRPRVACNPG